jgi:hypothetical protein
MRQARQACLGLAKLCQVDDGVSIAHHVPIGPAHSCVTTLLAPFADELERYTGLLLSNAVLVAGMFTGGLQSVQGRHTVQTAAAPCVSPVPLLVPPSIPPPFQQSTSQVAHEWHTHASRHPTCKLRALRGVLC